MMFKLIATKLNGPKVSDLISIICTRKDVVVFTGATVRVIEQETHGDYVPSVNVERTYNQTRVVLNDKHNTNRLEALDALRRKGGPEALASLLMVNVKQPKGREGSYYGHEVAVVIDDMTFEDILETHKALVVQEMVLGLTSNQIKELFSADAREVDKMCRVFNKDYSDSFLGVVTQLGRDYPDELIGLFCKFKSFRPGSVLDTHERIVEGLINDNVISRADLVGLVRLYNVTTNPSLIAKIKSRIQGGLTLENAIKILNEVPSIEINLLEIILSFINREIISGSEISRLNISSYLKHISVYVGYLMSIKDPNSLLRPVYSSVEWRMRRLTSFNYSKDIAQRRLKYLQFNRAIEAILTRVLRDLIETYRQTGSDNIIENILVILDMIKSRECVNALYELAEAMLDRAEKGGFLGGDTLLSLLWILKERNLEEGDFDRVAQMFIRASNLRKKAWVNDETKQLVLTQIAQLLKKIYPGQVEIGRSMREYLFRERPWADGNIRSSLHRFEEEEVLLARLRAIDSKVPGLIQFGYMDELVDSKQLSNVVVASLPAILEAMNDLAFDYFTLLRNPAIYEKLICDRNPLALNFFKALLFNLYDHPDKTFDYAAKRLLGAIVLLGGPNALEILQIAKRKNEEAAITRKIKHEMGILIDDSIARLEASSASR